MRVMALLLMTVSALAWGQPGLPAAEREAPGAVCALQPLEWPWAWGKEPLELHLIRLRSDAGERTAPCSFVQVRTSWKR